MSDAIELLKSIDKSLKTLVNVLRQGGTVAGAAGGAVAPDSDLDSQYGDEKVRFDPRDWTGTSMKGRTMSECPELFLVMYADAKDYFATKAEEKDERTDKGKPVADFERRTAARARGWAKRAHEGKSGSTKGAPPAQPGWAEAPDEDDIPFSILIPFLVPSMLAIHVIIAA